MVLGRTNLPTFGGGGGGSTKKKTSRLFEKVSKPKQSRSKISVSTPHRAAPKPAKKAPTPYRAPVYHAPTPRKASKPKAAVKKVSAPKKVVKAAPKPAEPAKPKPKSINDWLSGDATYQATLAALAKQLTNYNTDLDTQLTNYNTNFGSSLDDLGYTPGADGAEGTWNFDDPLSASGRAYQNLVNDFAARGMLQSTGYADAQNDLQTSLNDQLNQLNTARDQFTTGLANQRSSYADQNQTARQQAKAESIARRAAKYGLT